MPTAIDATERRFGRLTVEAPAGRVGRDTLWRCRCDCGTILTERLPNLTISNVERRVDACPACRATPCLVCGTPVLPERHKPRKTCSDTCSRALRQRRRREEYERALSGNLTFNAERAAEERARMATEPGYADHVRALKREAQRRRETARRADSKLDASHLAARRQAYSEQREKARERRRMKLLALPTKGAMAALDRKRGYDQRRHETLKDNPTAYKTWLEGLSEARRRRVLAEFVRIGDALTDAAREK